jgi:hypothetical protein
MLARTPGGWSALCYLALGPSMHARCFSDPRDTDTAACPASPSSCRRLCWKRAAAQRACALDRVRLVLGELKNLAARTWSPVVECPGGRPQTESFTSSSPVCHRRARRRPAVLEARLRISGACPGRDSWRPTNVDGSSIGPLPSC